MFQFCCVAILYIRKGVGRSPVACIEPPRAVPVLGPSTSAQPAELVAALTTGHVHTTLILFDWPLALGAWLGIGDDPSQVLAFCTILNVPLFHSFTVHRPVRLLLAGETKCAATLAHHVKGPACISDSTPETLHGDIAPQAAFWGYSY